MIHLLNWGMGVESTAILVRWLLEPETRPFEDWQDCIVLVAQTGNEYPETRRLCEKYIFPLLRENGVRLVQVAKAAASQNAGYVVLEDSRQPTRLWIEGAYRLGQNMNEDGYVPRLNRPHHCAMKWKGFVLDSWIADHVQEKFGPYLGYNSEESGRAKDARDYGCQGQDFIFPLIEWGWTRQQCEDYLFLVFGERWHKSCCVFCPFQNQANRVQHFQADPESAAQALWSEYIAMALNPRMKLFGSTSALDVCIRNAIDEAVEAFQTKLSESEWNIYRVRRIYKRRGKMINADRCTEILLSGMSQEQAFQHIQQLDGELDSHWRVYQRWREEGVYPAIEEFQVAAPAIIKPKVRSAKSFERDWSIFTGQQEQLSLHL